MSATKTIRKPKAPKQGAAKSAKASGAAGPHLQAETRLLLAGYRRIAGVDEVGRGPLAGPVVAAAVILDQENIPVGIDDSKALTALRRQELYEEILGCADVAVAYCSTATVDRINIRNAALLAMARALRSLPQPADAVLVDGRDKVPNIDLPCEALIGGDASSLSIAAASIVAKVSRDRMMAHCDGVFAGYELGSHKGYATPAHRAALTRLGPCRLHRASFAPIAALLAGK
ncbi:ribonuclease HII [Afifella aestuarii]|uniref:ribonuclease HII n=1 Tax=Afifella aestuarii TaxID=1909496 RepID=UPI000FE3B7F4|nr:ribonuclease HII [Afifella aestuarii]